MTKQSLILSICSTQRLVTLLLFGIFAGTLLYIYSFHAPAQAGAAFATITVTGTADNANVALLAGNGTCDLREAIEAANTNAPVGECVMGEAGLDTIQFSLGAGTPSIAVAAALPALNEPLTINGNTGGATRIELNGIGAGDTSGLNINAGGSTINALVINRFNRSGISISGAGGNTVTNCLIGVNAAGTAALPNNGNGIVIDLSNNHLIGGTTASARNIISGNGGDGIQISQGMGNTIQGNYIGTDITGTADLGNGLEGMRVFQSSNTTIGGTTAAARNVISGNDSNGVSLISSNTNDITGNFIGTQADGVSARANGQNGVRIVNSGDVSVGGIAAGEGNTIAFNTNHGVLIESGVFNSVLGNAIFGNGGLGINLGASDDGVTPNDPDDGDAGANNLQNFPVLTSATIGSGGVLVIHGTLDTTASTNVRIEFFSNPSCDGSGNGEGQVFLGFTDVTTSVEGGATISVTLPVSVTPGHFITATATTTSVPFNTSEFSACRVSYSGAIIIEDFSGGIPPTWTVIDGGDDGVTWTTTNPCGQVIPPPFSGMFAIVDASCVPPGVSLDEHLIPPAFNATGLGSVYVEFFNQFVWSSLAPNNKGDVDVSINGGMTWVNVLRLENGNDGFPTPNVKSIDITSVIAANPSNVLVRLHYYGQSLPSPLQPLSPDVEEAYWGVDFSIYSYALNATSQSFPANGGMGTVTVATSPNVPTPQGQWTATTNIEWIQITSNSPVTGNGMVSYTVDAHTGGQRSGTITIAGQTFTVRQGANFNDVPPSHPFYTEIGKLSANGITLGCTPTSFCPDQNVTREQMAIFIERAQGFSTPPTPMEQTFQDVPPTLLGYPFIEHLVARQITTGCSASPPLFCPSADVTRAQIAIFIVRALLDAGLNPPLPSPPVASFADVPNSGATDYSYEFIEEFYRREITSGCQASPRLYCPDALATRAQMAVFLVRAFGL